MRFFARPQNHYRHVAHFEGVLGTSLEVQVVASDKTGGTCAEAAILLEIDRLEAIFNAYKPTSELCHWQTTFGTAKIVSPELALVLEQAEGWRRATHGAFNPAVEALTGIWATGAKENRAVPQNEIEPLISQLQEPLWDVNLEKSTARRQTKLAVTLNSIAKGFIIDRACKMAAALETTEQVLLNIGGDIRHRGEKAVAVAIADPRSDAENANPACRVTLKNQGIATSGNYRRGFRIGESWFSHVLDPRSGYPVENLVGASVIAPDAMTADVLATAFSVLEPPESLALADSLEGIGVFLISSSGDTFSNLFWNEQMI